MVNDRERVSWTLRDALRCEPHGALCVSFSGGADSTALLHALAQLPQARARGLRALHVDHGLHPQSATWAAHCRQVCAALEIDCRVLPVQVDQTAGSGIEAAARDARYAALAQALQQGEWLLLGHHRDDQAETVLLKLLRGAGPEGLGGMRAMRALGRGKLWRPLLTLTRTQLRDYIDAHALTYLDDPSNADTRLARNRLRHDVLPRLRDAWPQAVDSILHSAALCRAAANTLQAQWRAALPGLRDVQTDSLDAHGWLALDQALREPLLDEWLRARGLTAPTAAQRAQIERQCHARAGQQPCVRWPGTELRIWRQRLWARKPMPPIDAHWETGWRGEPLPLPAGGCLRLESAVAALPLLPTPLTVRVRRGGERLKPLGHVHTRELRDLFQQAAIPPWLRAGCPLLYADDELIAVADVWMSERAAALFRAIDARPRWVR